MAQGQGMRKAIKAAAKKVTTEELIEQAADPLAASGRPLVRRDVPADASPEAFADPEQTALEGATIGPLPGDELAPPAGAADELVPEPVSLPEAGEIAQALDAPTPQQPRTLLRNVNIDYVDAPDQQKAIIDAISEQSQGFLSERRGRISMEETQQSALNIPEDVTLERLMRRKPGHIWNAEQSVAARNALVDAANVVHTLARDLTDPVAGRRVLKTTVTDEDLLEFRQAVSNMRAIQAAVQGNAAEVARALNSHKIPAGPAGIVRAVELMSEGGGRRTAQSMVEGFAGLENVDEVARAAEATWSAKFFDWAHTYWINALLSGPITHFKNVAGNSLFQVWTLGESAFAGTISPLIRRRMSRVIGEAAANSAGTERGEWMAEWYGMISSGTDAMRMAAAAGANKGGIIGASGGKIDIPAEHRGVVTTDLIPVDKDSYFGRALDFLDREIKEFPTALLQAEDEFFKAIAYRRSLAQQAYRYSRRAQPGDAHFDWQAEELGFTGPLTGPQIESTRMALMTDMLTAPDGDMHAEAVKKAQYLTFTDQPKGMGSAALELRNSFIGARWVMPFVRTPSRLIEAAVQRSPLGLAGATIDLVANFHKSELAEMIRAGGAQADEAIARIVLGNIAWAAVAGGVYAGVVTGNGPANREIRQAQRAQGWQPLSVKLGDRYYSYKWADPLALTLAGAASLAEAYRYRTGPEQLDEIAIAGAIGMAEAFGTKAYITGVADLIEIMSSGEAAPDKLRDYAARMAGSFVPNIINQTNPDPVLRDSRRGTSLFDEALLQIKSRIPEYSNDVPPRVDDWGRLITHTSWGIDQVSPIYMTDRTYDPVAEVARRNALTPTPPTNRVSIKGRQVDLLELPLTGHSKEGLGWGYYEYAKMVGQERHRLVSKKMQSKKFQELPPSIDEDVVIDENGKAVFTQRKFLREWYAEATAIAKAKFYAKYEDDIKPIMMAPPPEITDAAGNERDWRDIEF